MKRVLLLLKQSTNHSIYRDIAINFAIYFTLTFLSCNGALELFVRAYPSLETSLLNDVKEFTTGWKPLFPILVAPAFETSMLVYCITISQQIFKKEKIAIFYATLPVCLLHGIGIWQLPFIVFLPFYFQAVVYVKLRKNYPLFTCMLFVAILHALVNFIAIYTNM